MLVEGAVEAVELAESVVEDELIFWDRVHGGGRKRCQQAMVDLAVENGQAVAFGR
jgi:hypothetical protein